MALNRERFVRQYQKAKNTQGALLYQEESGRKACLAFFRCVKDQGLSDCLFLVPFLKDTQYLYESLRELNKRWGKQERESFFDQVVDVFDKEDMDEMVLISVWAKGDLSASSRLWDVASNYQAFGDRMYDWAGAVRTKAKSCMKHNDEDGLKKLQSFNLCGTSVLSEVAGTRFFDDFVKQDFDFQDYDDALDTLMKSSLTCSEKQKRVGMVLEEILKNELTSHYAEGLYLIFEEVGFSSLQKRLLQDHPNAKPSDLRVFMARAVRMREDAFDMQPRIDLTKQNFSKIAFSAIKKQKNPQGDVKKFLEKLKKHAENLTPQELSEAVYGVLTMPDPYQTHHVRKKSIFFGVFSDSLTNAQKISYLLMCAMQKETLLFTQAVKSLDIETLRNLDDASLQGHCNQDMKHILMREISKKEKRLIGDALKKDKAFKPKNVAMKPRVM